MDQYGLKDWTLKFGRGRKESGNCNYKTQTITFSAPLFHVWVQDHCRDTILHEIAHALTRGHNHDRVWKRTYIAMGGQGDRCWEQAPGRPALPPKFTGTCPAGHSISRDRRDQGSCNRCSPRFDERYLFTWTRNPSS